MPLATKVSFGPGDIVLDRDPAPHGKGHSTPALFGPCLLWPKFKRPPISAAAELL